VVLALLIDRMGNRTSGTQGGAIDGGEGVCGRFLNLHAAAHVHGNATEVIVTVAGIFGFGEMDGDLADLLAEATQRETEA